MAGGVGLRARTVAVVALLALPAAASEGVTEINMARALAGGVTPGDAPGLPVTLSLPGSYRLTGNLISGDQGVTAIRVTATSGVSVDLNGFAILCVEGGAFTRCGTAGSGGIGIDAAGVTDVRVSNGVVNGMDAYGIITGARAHIERVHASSDGLAGIYALQDSLVVDCTATNNTQTGIRVGADSRVEYSAANDNGTGIEALGGGATLTGNRVWSNGVGINAIRAVMVENAAWANDGFGIQCQGQCTIRGNAARANGGSGFSVDSGSTLDENAAYQNGSAGIFGLSGNAATGNALRSNVGFGLQFTGADNGWTHNVLTGNNGGVEVQASGGTQIPAGTNYCGTNVTCP